MKWKTVRLFSVTFVLSLAVLFSFGAIILLLPQHSGEAAAVESTASYYPRQDDNLSVLAIGKEDGENNALFFTLLRFDAEKGRLTLTGLPPDTEISIGTKTETLNRHYQQGGGSSAVRAVRQALRVSVDRYAVFDEDDLLVLADTLGGVEYQLEQDMVNSQTSLRQGLQTLDGARFRDAILFDENFELDLSLTKALIEQKIIFLTAEAADALFEKMTGLLDTNLSYYDYAGRKDALQAWAAKKDNVQIFSLSGAYDPDSGMYLPDQTSVEEYRTQIYGLES